MLVLRVSILQPAPALFWWYIYDHDKGPIIWIQCADRTYRSRSEAMEDGEMMLARLLSEGQRASL
jgi:hypothetical protein